MKELIKIFADDCEICAEMAKTELSFAKEREMRFLAIEMGELAVRPETDPLRGYVIHHHVDKSDGTLDVPVYLIRHEGAIQASGVIEDADQLTTLVDSWELWLKLRSID